MNQLVRPQALLLDFGGVIFSTIKEENGDRIVAGHVADMLSRGGIEVSHRQINRSISAGNTALKYWKHASSRRVNSVELTHREIVGDFLFSDLPTPARKLLQAQAQPLLRLMNTRTKAHHLREGMRELLEFCATESIPVGIVSNAHSGSSHREILAEHGLTEYFAVQIYSDEVGIRKPNPRMLTLAADALGVDVADCWYVGDTQDRDVVAGRRAGIGRMLLTTSKHTDNPPFDTGLDADAVYLDPRGVLDEIRGARTVSADVLAENEPTRGGTALLVDHGGVISESTSNEQALETFATEVAQKLHQIDVQAPDAQQVARAITEARAESKYIKRGKLTAYQDGVADDIPEQTPPEFWGRVARLLEHNPAWFRAEAHQLTRHFARIKSQRHLRRGIAGLMASAKCASIPVVVVSNTISGESVRKVCAEHGIDKYVAAYVCSDEYGQRKPQPNIFHEAMEIAQADPEKTFFLGDKPETDMHGAHLAGIAHRILLTEASTSSPRSDAGVHGHETLNINEPDELIEHIQHSLSPVTA